ncbi:hypothetical protein SDC9_65940 [bioreactor metagenome]|uniref:Transposase IS4-like domain-containing protein n=1 Tax=bioreactor metagenome TaxID=1076179 RepID=A0A644XZU1_9ZZZZ
MFKAPLAREAVATIQLIGEKWGTKRSVLTDEKGLPLAIVLSGANKHDIKLLEATLDHIMIQRSKPVGNVIQNLCLNAGYTGAKGRV